MTANDYYKQYRESNKDRLEQYRQAYRKDKKEQIKQYYETNRERIRQRRKTYREANKERLKEYYADYTPTLKQRFYNWKRGAKRRHRNIPFELTITDLESMPLICHYTGMPLTFDRNSFYTLSLDRIDSDKGYTKDNVVFCCGFINLMKHTLTVEQFIMACRKIVQHNASKN